MSAFEVPSIFDTRISLQTFIDAIEDVVLVTTPDGRITHVNACFERNTGHQRDDVLGARPGEILRCEGTDPAAGAAIDTAIANRCPIVQRILNRRKNGEEFVAEVSMAPICDSGGTVLGLLFVERDVTFLSDETARRADAERESRRLRAQLHAAIETMPDGFVLFDAEDRLVICNRRYREVYGDTAGAYQPGATFEDLLRGDVARGRFPDAVGREEEFLEDRLALHRSPAGPHIQRLVDGTWLRIVERRTSDGGLVGVRTDITELREKQLELERVNAELRTALAARDAAEKRFFDIAAISSDWFWEQDAELRFTFVSQSLLESTGYDPARAIGRKRKDIAFEGPYSDLEGDPAWLEEQIAHQRPFRDFVYRLAVPESDGRRHHWVRISGNPIFDEGGVFQGYRGVGSNISAMVEARERAELADRAKSRFLATMSHEIRTPMTAVIGHADLLVRQRDPAEMIAHARAISEAGDMLLSVVNDCLDLSRIEADRLVLASDPFSPALLVERIGRLFRSRAEDKGLRLSWHTDPSLEPLRLGDEQRLSQVLGNLVSNAITFTDRGEVALFGMVGGDGAIVIDVSDTGPGISAEDAARLFDAFAQGPGAQRRGGSGLGLAVVHQFVGLMKGTISVNPRPGGGTVMRLRLPLGKAGAGDAGQVVDGQAAAAKQRVLVVDDIATNREIIGHLLKEIGAGYRIVVSGKDAIAAASEER
ncbi:MAG: PAS domain S-box protein, partial [Pseudomonadota bacterium]